MSSLALLIGLLLAAGLAPAASAILPMPVLETLEVTHASLAGSWSLKPVSPRAAAKVPAGVETVAAFHLSRKGPSFSGDLHVGLPEIRLRARDYRDADVSVYVDSRFGGAMALTPSGYWLHGLDVGPDGLTFRLPLTAWEPEQDVFVVRFSRRSKADEFALTPDPADTNPLGDRVPVVMTHGYDSSETPLPFEASRDKTFNDLMRMREYREMWKSMKFYRFSYRPYMPYPELGRHFADELLKAFGTTGKPILLMAHSAGGLASRYAAADPRLKDRIAGILTLATPHHGAVVSSILQANGNVATRLGWLGFLLLRRAQRSEPDTPALRSIALDNSDGTIDHEAQERFGIRPNTELAAFNAADPNVGKIIAYHGKVSSLWGRGDYWIGYELQRRALSSFSPSWGTADPIVHLQSGSFEGAPVGARHLFPNKNHAEMVHDPAVLRVALRDIGALRRAALATERDARFSETH